MSEPQSNATNSEYLPLTNELKKYFYSFIKPTCQTRREILKSWTFPSVFSKDIRKPLYLYCIITILFFSEVLFKYKRYRGNIVLRNICDANIEVTLSKLLISLGGHPCLTLVKNKHLSSLANKGECFRAACSPKLGKSVLSYNYFFLSI